MKRAALLLVLLTSIAACRDDFFDPNPGASGPPQPPSVEFAAENLRMLPGSAEAIRVGFQSKDDAARVRITRSSSEGRVIACPLRSIDEEIPEQTACLPDLPNGVREPFTLAGLTAIALVREGAPVTLGIRIEFADGGRGLAIRFPVIERPPSATSCEDNACNPFFEVKPVRGGDFSASATWSGGEARMEMLEGRVLAKAFSATGIPYRVAGQAQGPSGISITARLDAPSEYALALSNASSGDLRGVEIRASWP